MTFSLELLWMNQCIEEVQAEPHGDDQSYDRFTHLEPLKLTQGVRVDAHQRQNRQSKRYKRDIEHDPLLASGRSTVERHKLSIPNRGSRRKDSIKLCGDAASPQGTALHRRGGVGRGGERSPSRSPHAFVDANAGKDVVAGSNGRHGRLERA